MIKLFRLWRLWSNNRCIRGTSLYMCLKMAGAGLDAITNFEPSLKVVIPTFISTIILPK